MNDFISLFYPKVCLACGRNLYSNEDHICTECLYSLPNTYFKNYKDNPVCKLFWGRVKIEYAGSLYYYQKGSRLQSVIHHIKYKGQKEAGYFLGGIIGSHLISTPLHNIDIVIPVPLHYKKQKVRGFNQSEYIGRGIADKLKKPLFCNVVKRIHATDTQTRKSRYDRWENVKGIFQCTNEGILRNKHILIVDDIVTTGSTLEACANEILTVKGSRVSIITVAYADM